MSDAVIKSSADQSRVGSLVGVNSAEPSLDPRELEIRALEDEIAALHQAMRALKEDHQIALKDAAAKAAAEAREQERRDEAEQLDALKAGLKDSVASLQSSFAALNDQAPLLAIEALRPLLNDPERYQTLIKETVQRQCATLADSTVVEVVVSAADFPDAARLDALSLPAEVNTTIDPNAPAGQVRTRVRLGWLECSIPGYWQQLQALVSELSTRESAS